MKVNSHASTRRWAGRHLSYSGQPRTGPTQSATRARRLAWDAATRLAVANAGVFFVLSLLGDLAIPEAVEFHRLVALLFFVGSLFAFYRLITANALDAMAFYVFGAGLFFGFGTYYGANLDDYVFQLFFSASIQEQYIANINLMNAASVFIVILAASLSSGKYESVNRTSGIRIIFDVLIRFRHIFFSLALIDLALLYYTFPRAENLLVRGALGNAYAVVPLAIMLIISYRRRVSTIESLGVLALTFIAFFLGLSYLSKTRAMLPILALNIGLFLDKSSRKLAVAVGILAVLGYYFFVSPVVTAGRRIADQSGRSTTLVERAISIYELTFDLPSAPAKYKSSRILMRFSAAPIQYYLMHEYDEGRPGQSLTSWWDALVPRLLWPDKPNVTRFGPELYSVIFHNNPTSALAPTYTAEAYWNYGWIGVIVVSLVIGLEIGWLTRKWRDFMSGKSSNLGIVVFTVPIALFSFWVETWIAASYVGGFVTLVVLIKAFDSIPALRRQSRS